MPCRFTYFHLLKWIQNCVCTVKSFQWSQFCFIKSCDLTTHFKSNKNDRWQFIEYKVFYNVNMHGNEWRKAFAFFLSSTLYWELIKAHGVFNQWEDFHQSSLGVLWHQFSKRWKADCKIVTMFTVVVGHYIDCTVNWTWKKFNCEDVASLNTWAYYVWLLSSLNSSSIFLQQHLNQPTKR